MSNPSSDYKTFTLTADPDIVYDTNIHRFVVNGKRFVTYKQAAWYKQYIVKFGFVFE
jgi:hypothetical protein